MTAECIEAKIGGETYYLQLNLEANFQIQELGDDAVSRMDENNMDGFKATYDLFSLLCKQGEAARRAYGYPSGPSVPDWDKAQYQFLPADLVRMKAAVIAAFQHGYERKVPDEEDVDLTLLEAQKKTGKRRQE